MDRLLIVLLAWIFATSIGSAAEVQPEQLLSPTTQVYLRWDGYTAHKEAYAKSARGRFLAGDMGKTIDALMERVQASLRTTLLGEPLLEGTLPEELLRRSKELKGLFALPGLMGDSGVVLGLEVRPATYTWDDLIAAYHGKIVSTGVPQILMTIVLPNAAKKPEPFGAMRLMGASSSKTIQELKQPTRTVYWYEDPDEGAVTAWWAEGEHFVLVIGNQRPEIAVARVQHAGVGITDQPLYRKLKEFREFTTVTRGFVDLAQFVELLDRTIQKVDSKWLPYLKASGLPGVKSARIYEGFEGEYSRGVIEIDLPGKRQGLTKIFGGEPLTAKDLPPIPVDASRWLITRLDIPAIYDMALLLDQSSSPKDYLDPQARFDLHRQKARQEIDDALGFPLDKLFAALGDKVVTYSSPMEGILGSGQVLAISIKDEKALAGYFAQLLSKAESASSNSIRIRKQTYLGADLLIMAIKERSPITPCFAICDGWLVMAFQPQPVQGFIMRSRKKLPSWKPDARTEATLAKIPQNRVMLQYADPRSSISFILNGAPILAALGLGTPEPFDVSVIPHPEKACEGLFPNVAWATDDGKTMRWESKDSLWLPLEFMGPEVLLMYYGLVFSAF